MCLSAYAILDITTYTLLQSIHFRTKKEYISSQSWSSIWLVYVSLFIRMIQSFLLLTMRMKKAITVCLMLYFALSFNQYTWKKKNAFQVNLLHIQVLFILLLFSSIHLARELKSSSLCIYLDTRRCAASYTFVQSIHF